MFVQYVEYPSHFFAFWHHTAAVLDDVLDPLELLFVQQIVILYRTENARGCFHFCKLPSFAMSNSFPILKLF